MCRLTGIMPINCIHLLSLKGRMTDCEEKGKFCLRLRILIGEGNGNPLQCSCLENPRDGGAWWAAIYGVAQSWTRLKRLSSSRILILNTTKGRKQRHFPYLKPISHATHIINRACIISGFCHVSHDLFWQQLSWSHIVSGITEETFQRL